MCGILLEIRQTGYDSVVDTKTLQRIKKRGPDCNHLVELKDEELTLLFCAAVLWMQGSKPAGQPLKNDHSILLYNGDIFDDTWDTDRSDTEVIMEKLGNQEEYSEKHVINQLKSLKGPFSLIYYDKRSRNLYFTRDRIGRTSLIFNKNENSLIISSVMGRGYNCCEIPATHIHKLDLKTLKLTVYPWKSDTDEKEYVLGEWLEENKKHQSLPDDQFSFEFDNSIDLSDEEGVIKAIQSAVKINECKVSFMKNLMEILIIKQTVNNVCKLLENSVRKRVEKHPNKCKDCIQYEIASCNHCTVGVLFSGGLDCTILSLLADKFVDKNQPIDLLNVAFDINGKACFDVPDRISGKQSYEELKNVCSSRQWIFKEIDVCKDTLEQFQKSTIADLVFPRNTVLDESLGSALWFASSSETSSCRVLLLGSGADELFGGYLRHRKAFQRNGWLGLAKELQFDWNRISFRNLSRDNRVICDHGRQPRMPYLDEDFVNYVLKLKPWLRCFPCESLDCGVGDKLMLRLAAMNLGLTKVVTFPKRALQFGSRIANKKQKGGDLSKNFIE